MRILYCGDIVGRSGRDVVQRLLPKLKKEHAIDFIIVNGENSAHGFGISSKICESLYSHGVDVITTGNHVWDQKEILSEIHSNNRLLRPANYPESSPGKGFIIYKDVMVINVMGRLFMPSVDDPFAAVMRILQNNTSNSIKAIFVDIHAEATAEKMALAYYLDGKVSAVIGSHTHVPTSDERILTKGTAYQSDAGMCGDYNSVLGMQIQTPINRFVHGFSIERLQPATGEATLCATLIDTDTNGLCTEIKRICLGPHLVNYGF